MSKPNILIVDDEAEARSTIKRFMMNRLQCNIFEADNGQTAMDFLSRNSCDIMILDMRMPRKSGMEVLDETQKKDQNIDAIVITAWDSDLVAEECAKRDVECIPKPLIMTELYDKTIKLLKKRHQLIPNKDA